MFGDRVYTHDQSMYSVSVSLWFVDVGVHWTKTHDSERIDCTVRWNNEMDELHGSKFTLSAEERLR
jgi:hypothetical protein